MNPEIERFLNLANLPARATTEQAAGLLGFSPHEIPILTARGLLKPLGHPAPNAPKFFVTEAMKELRRDEKWMGKASDAISEYWRIKNNRKGESSSDKRSKAKETDIPQYAENEN
jgi:hypothetical protein